MIRVSLFLFLTLIAQAQVIPESRRYDWVPGKTIGIPGGIPLAGMTEWTNFVTAGGVGDGVTDNYSVLNALVNTPPPSNTFIRVPAGRYYISAAVGLNTGSGGWAIVGEGTNTVFTNAVSLLNGDYNLFGAPFRLHGTHAKGVTNLTTAGQDMSAYLRKTIRITRSEAIVPEPDVQVQDIYFDDRLLRQLVVVETVSNGTNFTIDRPTMWEFAAAYDPWVEVNSGVYERVGFYNFTFEGGSSSGFNIFGCRFFWWQKVKSVQIGGYFLNDVNNLGFEVRDSYATCTAVGSGAALFLFTGSSGHWFENNYGINGSPFFEVNGTSASAFTYNYATNNASDPNLGAGAYVGNPYNSHGSHAMMNLFEGDFGTMVQYPDAYFGSASHTTFFRNWFTGYDPVRSFLPRVMDINEWGTYMNVVGNKLGSTNATGWVYMQTNDSYAASTPSIFTLGYTAPGHRNYNQLNTGNHWKYPNARNRVGLITNTAAIPTNRIAGTFTNIAEGDFIIIQSAANTNHYYPYATNFQRVSVAAVDAAYIEINRDRTSTNNDTVYKIGDGQFFDTFKFYETFNTTLIHGNTDASNGFNVILWDTTGTVTDSNLPPSLIYGSTRPTWATNFLGSLTWPYVNPTNAVVGDWAARSLWEDGPAGPVRTIVPQGLKIQGAVLR